MLRIGVQTKTWAVFAAILLGIVLFAIPAAAQSDVTTARISGTVKDADGAVVPGATVTATNEETGLVLKAFSDGRGYFRIINLPSGTYTVAAELAGFATSKRTGVRLLLGEAPTVDFTLQLASASDSIVVTSEVPLVEVSNTSVSTTLQNEQIKQLPIANRDFTSLVLLTPESRRDKERQGLSLSGQRGINTNVTLDGVDYTNAFFGGTAGTAEGRAPISISQEAVKEIVVITNGASAEFGRSGGGFVNVITKSGTNQLKGSAFYYWQPNDTLAKRRDGIELNNQDQKQYGVSLGGPIIKDKMFFFFTYDEQKRNEDVTIAPVVMNADIFAKYPALTSDSSFGIGKDGRALFGRADYQITPYQRVTARARYSDYTGLNGTNTRNDNGTKYNGTEGMFSRSYVASYSGMFGDNLLNDFNGQYYLEDTPRKDNSPTLADVRIGAVRYGGVYFLPIDSSFKRKNFGDTVTYLIKTHMVKAGLEFNESTMSQTFKGDWRGVYTFNSVNDALAGKWSQFYQFIGLNGISSAEAGTITVTQKELALFVQDQWYITPTLTATAGLRWENLDNPNKRILNPTDRNADGSYNLTAKIPDTKNQWSPRVSLNWSPGGKGKMVLRFSAGRFWARSPSILWAQLYSSNGTRGARYTINWDSKTMPNGPTDTLAPGWGNNFNPVGVAPIDSSKITKKFTGLDVYAIDPDFQNPYTDRYTIGGDQEIFKDMVLSVDATWAKGYHLQRLTDINLQYDIDPQTGKPKVSPANGMPMYAKARPNSYYGRITTSTSDGESEYQAISMTLRRRFNERLFGFAAVTWSKDKDNDSNERNYAGIQAEDVNNVDNNWGYSDRDQRWKIVLNTVWNSPFWGLSVSGSYRYYTGQSYTAYLSYDANGDNVRQDRPTVDETGKPSATGTHLGRNTFREPDNSFLDMRLQKSIKIGPGVLAVMLDCFNCNNNANEGVTSTSYASYDSKTNKLSEKSPYFGSTAVTNQVRTLQFSLRFEF